MIVKLPNENDYLQSLLNENATLDKTIKESINRRDINNRIISALRDRLGIKLLPFTPVEHGDVVSEIRSKALSLNGSEITVAAVQELLPAIPRTTISGTLSKMKELNCTQKGIGRRPAIYERK